jgi:hypothetical protein
MFARRTVLFGLGLVVLGPARHASAQEPVEAGSVVDARGPATSSREGQRRKLLVGAVVFLEDLLGTGPAARLSVRLGTATRLSLGERTRVRIDKMLMDRGGELTLERGAMLFDRPADQPSGDLDVVTPFGLIVARGTTFWAGPSQGKFGVFVQHGVVTVRTRAGEVSLTQGMGTDLTSIDVAPTPPKAWGAPRIRAALASVS